MIDWRDPDGRMLSALRWTVAGLAVVGLHAGGVWLALNWPKPAEAAGEPPAAIMMELTPLAVSPEAPQQDVAPGPEMVEAEDQPEPEKPIDEKVKPEPTPQPPVKTEIKPPELPDVKTAEVVLPPKVEPPKPKPKPKKKKQKAAPRTTAPPRLQIQRADRAAAPAEGQSSSMSAATWRGALMAHLNRHKRFPPGATGAGVATVAFTIDRSGRVLSSRLVRSSGDAALDAETVSLPRRASPVPAPPPNVGGGSITLAVPIRFTR
jgi:protein TonB